MVNNFQRIKDCYGDASTGTLYFYTIVAFLEKWCAGTSDVETAANMIMSKVTDLANSQDVEVNLRLVSSATLIAYYGSTPKFKLKSQFSHQMITAIVFDNIPEDL